MNRHYNILQDFNITNVKKYFTFNNIKYLKKYIHT
jgi:hypothetical protein